MTLADFKAKLKSQNVSGAYIFSGEEDYLKKFYLKEFANICCPDESFALFNQVIYDGNEVEIADIAEAIKSPPMMSDGKLVVWKYPMLDRMSESEKKAIEELAGALSDFPYATLVLFTDIDGFDPGTQKRPSKLAARLGKVYDIVNFEKSTDAQLIGWLGRHFSAEGIEATQDVLSALIFRSGHGMEILKHEVEKLSAYAKSNGISRLNTETVELVASPTLECDAFALSGAITDKSREKAFLALADMQNRRIDAAEVLATLSRAFSELVIVANLLEEGMGIADIEALLKWNHYKLKFCSTAAKKWGSDKLFKASDSLRKLDAASKSGGASGYKMIEIFICEFL
jgi:DNA polymerase-3 subunit delta